MPAAGTGAPELPPGRSGRGRGRDPKPTAPGEFPPALPSVTQGKGMREECQRSLFAAKVATLFLRPIYKNKY